MFFRTRGRPENALLGIVLLLVATTAGWIIIGVGLCAGGLFWGFTSHQVTYFQGEQGAYQSYTSADGTFVLFQQQGTDTYYVMFITDYTPLADPATLQYEVLHQNHISFLASSEMSTVTVDLNGQTVESAHPIEKITFSDDDGQNPVTYTNTSYSGHPQGYTVNHWPLASLLLLAGLLCTGLALFLHVRARQRRKRAKEAEIAALEARPSPFARELAGS